SHRCRLIPPPERGRSVVGATAPATGWGSSFPQGGPQSPLVMGFSEKRSDPHPLSPAMPGEAASPLQGEVKVEPHFICDCPALKGGGICPRHVMRLPCYCQARLSTVFS